MKTNLEPVAGGGLLDRRLFLKQGLLFSVATALPSSALAKTPILSNLTSKPDWMRTPGKPFSNYGMPSEHEKKTIRWTMANSMTPGNGVSWTPLQDLEGIITPNGLHFERHHNGVPQIDPKQHQLLIHGLVKNPLIFSLDDLLRYPMQSKLCFIECGGNSNAGWRSDPIQTPVGYVHGMVSCSEWTGIPLKLLLNEAQLRKKAFWIIAEGADAAAINISIPIEKAMDDVLLALYQNGERLRPENGYPVRLIVPGWEGILHIKWLRRIHISDRPVMSRNETAKYTELLPSGKAQQFSFPMQAKSLITKPSFGQRLTHPGLYQINGLAWSGAGKIRHVEVSADSGLSWAKAELQAPILDKCFTRFRIPWQWDGRPAIIKSRATDESGYIQPERPVLIQQKGQYGYFHYNAIVSWSVSSQGEISHVYA
ncbi:MAG: sulfite dehydrogenase [Methylococcaceae bacterium]